jgi:hydrogenase-4 membrane subunit HyfE
MAAALLILTVRASPLLPVQRFMRSGPLPVLPAAFVSLAILALVVEKFSMLNQIMGHLPAANHYLLFVNILRLRQLPERQLGPMPVMPGLET